MPRIPEPDLKDQQTYRAARTDELIGRRARDLGVSRRHLLRLLAAGGALATAGGLARRAPAAQADVIAKPTPAEWFNVYGSNAEMRWEQMRGRGYVVPNDLFFVRNHSKPARLDAAAWRLAVEGTGVLRPQSLSYDDLLRMPSVKVVRSVECAGNGRSFFEKAYGKKASGTQWKLGGIGVAEWTGVRLGEVLDRVGLKSGVRDVMPQGQDDLKVRRPMPLAKAMEADTLLVYAMNGEPLPPDHGFPVRVLTPGWVGVQNIKWVGRIEVSTEPLFSPWNTEHYVLMGPDYEPAPPAKGPVLSTQALKSALELPWDAKLPPGRAAVTGRSWSPFGKIAKVEYSIDRGPWREARLSEPNIARAWASFGFDWDAEPGEHAIRIRATDETGRSQPDSVTWNDEGYLYNGVVDHPVTVG